MDNYTNFLTERYEFWDKQAKIYMDRAEECLGKLNEITAEMVKYKESLENKLYSETKE